MIEQRTSDYHFKDFRPEMKLFPDMIPFVGLVTVMERERKRENESLTNFYLGFLKITKKEALSMGTANWPEGTTREANIRSFILAGRNALFPIYHFVLAPAAIEAVGSFIGK